MLPSLQNVETPTFGLVPAVTDGGPVERLLKHVYQSKVLGGEPTSLQGALSPQKSI